jgi:hypothetical protein
VPTIYRRSHFSMVGTLRFAHPTDCIHVIASAAKQSNYPQAETWIASLRSQ